MAVNPDSSTPTAGELDEQIQIARGWLGEALMKNGDAKDQGIQAALDALAGTEQPKQHAVSMTGHSRGPNGKRQISYGYCTCGAGTTNSLNRASVLAKLAKHAAGDDSGMVRP